MSEPATRSDDLGQRVASKSPAPGADQVPAAETPARRDQALTETPARSDRVALTETPARSDDLGDLLLRCARLLRRANADALAPHGTNPHQARALRVIDREAPLRPSQLAELLHVNPRSATENVDNLVAAGWVERNPDPADRRATLLTLTPAGREQAATISAIRASQHAHFFETLDASDRDQLRAILTRLATPEAP